MEKNKMKIKWEIKKNTSDKFKQNHTNDYIICKYSKSLNYKAEIF